MGLRALRLNRRMTQKQLADKLGVTRQYLSHFENGERDISNMTLGNAIRICDALGVANPRKLLESDDSTKK